MTWGMQGRDWCWGLNSLCHGAATCCHLPGNPPVEEGWHCQLSSKTSQIFLEALAAEGDSWQAVMGAARAAAPLTFSQGYY